MRNAVAVATLLSCTGLGAAHAHFQELIPSTPIVTAASGPQLRLDLTFTHPMARGPVMPMGDPAAFGVVVDGERHDLRAALRRERVDGADVYHAAYRVRQPGDHLFYLEPAPYWEPAEGALIVHYTKVVVDGYQAGGGWDGMVGFPVEIEPLTRPYGLWTGNSFCALVRRHGRPAPFATVEVEWRNDGSLPPPQDPFVTQELKADPNGVFCYAAPRAGWWGFAALLEGDAALPGPDGEPVPVELGGLIWVSFRDMP